MTTTTTMNGVREPVPGFYLIPNFDKKIGMDANTFIGEMQGIAPARGADDEIVPGGLQFVLGSNPNLKYRGNELKRAKIWFQDGPVKDGVRVYSYTGFIWNVAAATSDWNDCDKLKIPSEGMKDFMSEWDASAPAMNHGILTMYKDGSHNIGWHYDKDRSLSKGGWIAVLKLGPHPRRFALRKRAGEGEEQDKMPVLFDEIVEPGTLILMSLETNLATQHAVPECGDDSMGLSGSIVWRAVHQVVSQQDLAKKMANTEKGRGKRAAEKAEREAKKAREE